MAFWDCFQYLARLFWSWWFSSIPDFGEIIINPDAKRSFTGRALGLDKDPLFKFNFGEDETTWSSLASYTIEEMVSFTTWRIKQINELEQHL